MHDTRVDLALGKIEKMSFLNFCAINSCLDEFEFFRENTKT